MNIIEINRENIDREHICCAIGADKENKARAQTKKDWMKDRFQDGLVFKRLDDRGKVFIEYMPIETVWKPIVGQNYLVINCLWVSGKFKGQGFSSLLLNECIADAKAQGKSGVAVVSSREVKPFLTDKKFFVKHGFSVADTAPPYFELLALRFDPTAELPRFSPQAKSGRFAEQSEGLMFVYARQCPFMEDYVHILASIAQKNGFPATIIRLNSREDALSYGSPFGSLGVYYRGAFVFHELMTEQKFEDFLQSLGHDQS